MSTTPDELVEIGARAAQGVSEEIWRSQREYLRENYRATARAVLDAVLPRVREGQAGFRDLLREVLDTAESNSRSLQSLLACSREDDEMYALERESIALLRQRAGVE